MSHHHQAVDNLINVFARASHDLTVVHSKLEKEFQQTYPENANPMKLVMRIKKLQEDVAVLKDQCLELLSAKQDLIDKAQKTLVGNCNLIQKMNISLGESTNGDADDALADFNQVGTLLFIGNVIRASVRQIVCHIAKYFLEVMQFPNASYCDNGKNVTYANKLLVSSFNLSSAGRD